MSSRLIKPVVFIAWFILIGMLINRDFLVPTLTSDETTILQKAREEYYYGVWFKNKRIGYVVEELHPQDDGTLVLRQTARLNLNILDITQQVDMDLKARLNRGLYLRDFKFNFTTPFYSMKASGEVVNNKVSFSLDTGRSTIRDSITLSKAPLPPINQRAYLLKNLPNAGDKIKITSFDPISLVGKDAVVEYRGRDKILILDTVHNAHHFVEQFAGISISFWLNDQGKIIKEESAAGFTLLAEPKFRAKDIEVSGDELLDSVAVKFSGTLPAPERQTVTYRLTLPPGLEHQLGGGRQTLEGDLLTIRRENKQNMKVTGACRNKALLKPSRYVQSAHPDIQQLARDIVGDSTDPEQQVRLLSQWVYDNLEKRPVLGLPDALTTLRSKRGDCNEHAALFAALARGLEIPTSIVTGVTLFRGAFYYHAWNEVCLNGNWFSLDTTTNQVPADLTHIRFGRGDLEEQLKIGALLNKLQIEILDGEPASAQ